MPQDAKTSSTDGANTKQEECHQNTSKRNEGQFLNLQTLSSNWDVDDDAESTCHGDGPQGRVAGEELEEARTNNAEHVGWAHLEHDRVQEHCGASGSTTFSTVREGEGG